MPYEMHRIFCATPPELEDEREEFHRVLADFNERVAMPRNILLVGVSLTPLMPDKRSLHGPIQQNMKDARYYLLVLEDGWGPPVRNFERDYALAQQYIAAGTFRINQAHVVFKEPLLPHRVENEIREWKERLEAEGTLQEFADMAAWERILREKLQVWLEEICGLAKGAATGV